jgi:hypothetical protein
MFIAPMRSPQGLGQLDRNGQMFAPTSMAYRRLTFQPE